MAPKSKKMAAQAPDSPKSASQSPDRGWPADTVQRWPIEKVAPRATNPRTHSAEQVEEIANAIREWGWTNPILVDEQGEILAGHGRILAAQTLGITEVPVMVAKGWSEAQKRAYLIADNKLATNAGWNEELLRAEITALEASDFDLKLMGFSEEELDALYPPEAAEGNASAEQTAPPRPDHPITVLGDVWLCGAHRVMCGDARRIETVQALMGEHAADCVWTDPPYNVDYEGGGQKIQNDAKPDERFRALLRQAFKAVHAVLAPGAAIYVAHADTEGLTFRREFEDAGFHLASCLIWKKNSLVLGRSDYNWQHEPILYGWKLGAAHRWYGERNKTTILEFEGALFEQIEPNVWIIYMGETSLLIKGKDLVVERKASTVMEEPKPARSKEHPTMKPVALIERMLANSTKPRDRVLDIFGGSGSTLIAAHKLHRIAHVLELDPKYCDVIVKRWQEFAGKPALRERDGLMFDKASDGAARKKA